MRPDTQLPDLQRERLRSYLRAIVLVHLDRRLRRRMDASDIVQEAMLRAHARADQFRGRSEGERLAWLRVILLNILRDRLRELQRRPERDEAVQRSSIRVDASIAAAQASPSAVAVQHEQAMRLASALAQLPPAQREAIELQKLHGHTLAEVAERLRRSEAAVAGLLKRGLAQLRDLMKEPS